MFFSKIALFLALAVACVFAAPKPGHILAAEPLAYAAPAVAVAHSVPVATSYQNTYKVSHKSPVIATTSYVAPAVAYAAAPAPAFAYSAPLSYAAHAAPLAYY